MTDKQETGLQTSVSSPMDSKDSTVSAPTPTAQSTPKKRLRVTAQAYYGWPLVFCLFVFSRSVVVHIGITLKPLTKLSWRMRLKLRIAWPCSNSRQLSKALNLSYKR